MILLGTGPLIPKREKTHEEAQIENIRKKPSGVPGKRRPHKNYATLKEKVEDFVIVHENGCWCQDTNSYKDILDTYPTLVWEGKRKSTRLIVYAEFIGKLPEGKHIHLSCGNKGCVNPEHFVLVDHLNPEIDSPTKRALSLINQEEMPNGCWQLKGRGLKEAATIDFRPKNHPTNTRGIVYLARPLVYEHYIGPIPENKWVKTSCCNAGCVNPEHMFLGNTKMAPLKENGMRPDSRFTYEEVQDIKRMLAKGIARSAIGKKYGVTWGFIYKIDKGLIYPHVTID